MLVQAYSFDPYQLFAIQLFFFLYQVQSPSNSVSSSLDLGSTQIYRTYDGNVLVQSSVSWHFLQKDACPPLIQWLLPVIPDVLSDR